MHIIVTEPGYADSVWCKEILHGLLSELKKRREEFRVCTDSSKLGSQDTVFIIGAAVSWLDRVAGECTAAGAVPILLCSSLPLKLAQRHHLVCSDIDGSMRQLATALNNAHPQRVALYGINPASAGDRCRREAFLSVLKQPSGVYENSISLDDCYTRFRPHRENYSAVLCANSFAAVSLVRRLRREDPALLENLTVISCSQGRLSGFCGGSITCVDMHFALFGKTALSIADMVRKLPHIAGVTAAVRWSVEGLSLDVPTAAPNPTAAETDTFYADAELQRMLRLENLLDKCDEIDLSLLSMLLEEKNYAQMAQACYLTEGAVKYRIRNMRELCDADGKESLTALLREYLLWE